MRNLKNNGKVTKITYVYYYFLLHEKLISKIEILVMYIFL